MKAKHAIIILALGWCFEIVGALLKIMHWYGSSQVFLIATSLMVIGGLLLVYKILTYPKIKDFLNR